MNRNSSTKTIVLFLALIVGVVSLSLASNRLWGGSPEKLPEPRPWVLQKDMTVGEFGQANDLPNPVLKEIFGLQAKSDLQRKLSDYGTADQIKSMATKRLALAAEHASKNWVKIPAKFVLWLTFLIVLFIRLKKRSIPETLRKGLLFVSVLIFGVIMGSDPSPMGTVKDAIHLYGSARAVFPPRMIALSIFLLSVFLVNKYICAWGCQAGALQDLIFRLNRTEKGAAILGKRFKPPFVLTNTVRVLFLLTFAYVAFAQGTDIIEPIDPFRIYKPAYIGLGAGAFIAVMLIASLFTYRPWCHFFCPFGLVGWVVEKISLVKISVDYETCIACGKCADACPSTVMGAILGRNKKTIPDCFACYTCRDICPTESIRFSSRKRTLPPQGHFMKKGHKQVGGGPSD